MPTYLTENMSVHLVATPDLYPHPGKKVSTSMDDVCVEVMNVYEVMGGMKCGYKPMSVLEGEVVDACEGFIMTGPVFEMTRSIKDMGVDVNNIMVCTLCWRNCILTGRCSLVNKFDFKINTNYPHDPPKVRCTQKVYLNAPYALDSQLT